MGLLRTPKGRSASCLFGMFLEHSMSSPFAKSALFSTKSANIMKVPNVLAEPALPDFEDLEIAHRFKDLMHVG